MGSGVDDTLARLVITPLVGIVVPNLSGLIENSAHSIPALVLS